MVPVEKKANHSSSSVMLVYLFCYFLLGVDFIRRFLCSMDYLYLEYFHFIALLKMNKVFYSVILFTRLFCCL